MICIILKRTGGGRKTRGKTRRLTNDKHAGQWHAGQGNDVTTYIVAYKIGQGRSIKIKYM